VRSLGTPKIRRMSHERSKTYLETSHSKKQKKTEFMPQIGGGPNSSEHEWKRIKCTWKLTVMFGGEKAPTEGGGGEASRATLPGRAYSRGQKKTVQTVHIPKMKTRKRCLEKLR